MNKKKNSRWLKWKVGISCDGEMFEQQVLSVPLEDMHRFLASPHECVAASQTTPLNIYYQSNSFFPPLQTLSVSCIKQILLDEAPLVLFISFLVHLSSIVRELINVTYIGELKEITETKHFCICLCQPLLFINHCLMLLFYPYSS